MKRYFTFRTGRFNDGCRAIVFTGHARYFLKDDCTLVPQKLWTHQDALDNVEKGEWIEIGEAAAYGREVVPETAGDHW